MTITTRKKTLQEMVNTILFEQGAFSSVINAKYGIYDRPIKLGASPHDADNAEDQTTVPEEVPVAPSEMMAQQLASDRPPIEDDEYIPSAPEELARAANAIMKMIPNDQVEFAYQRLHHLLDDATKRQNSPDTTKADTPQEEDEELQDNEKVIESFLRRAIHHLVEQAEQDLEDPTAPGDGASLEAMAAEFGYSGPSGMRQDIEKVLARVGFLGKEATDVDLDEMHDFAVKKFIDELINGGYIDDDDASELKKNPSHVMDLDSYRFFLNSTMAIPAFNELKKGAKKRVEDHIGKLKLPDFMVQAITNQATGATPTNVAKLISKLTRLGQKQEMLDTEIEDFSKKIIENFDELKNIGKAEGDIFELMKSKWNSAPKGKRQRLIRQALQYTTESME